MFSAEKEEIPFNEVLDPRNKNVEDWMTELEKMMKCSVRYRLKDAVDDYHKAEKRTVWVNSHAGMCVLNGS